MKSALREYLSEIGRRGGQATGESKRRGNSEYYRKIARKAARSRRKKDKP